MLFAAAGIKMVGYALDGVDGALSQLKPNHNKQAGQLLDYLVDRVEK